MPRSPVLLCCLLLAACGGDEPPRPTPPAGGISAFQFPRAPAGLRHEIAFEEIVNGIGVEDPRDKIPAFFEPEHVAVSRATHLEDADRVLVVEVKAGQGREARAYPLYVLDGHELVNDVVGGQPVLVTWCPLCGSGAVFERTIGGVVRTFGVSGYLWRSDVLMYDRESESFWSQIAARAVVGPLTGTPLTALPTHVSTWSDFQTRHPDGRVLLPGGTEGYEPAFYRRRPYYAGYRADDSLLFGAVLRDRRLRAKEEVIGVVVDGVLGEGHAHAWSLPFLRAATADVREQVGGTWRFVRYDRAGDRAEVLDETGAPVVSLRAYWFAWTLFHPETGLSGGGPGR